MRQFSRHLPHYVSLIAILAAATAGFYLFAYDKVFQTALAVAVGSAYVVWGVVHHLIHRDFSWGVLGEYLIFGILGVIVVVSLIYRS